jgi:hypothetical protein
MHFLSCIANILMVERVHLLVVGSFRSLVLFGKKSCDILPCLLLRFYVREGNSEL